MLTMRASQKITFVLVTVHLVAFVALAITMFHQAKKDIAREQQSAFATAKALMQTQIPAHQLQSILQHNRHLSLSMSPAVQAPNIQKYTVNDAQLRYFPNDGSGVQVTVSHNQNAELDEVKDTVLQVFVVFLLSLATSLLLLSMAVKARLQPLRRLSEALASVQQGNYRVEVEACDISEINQLISHYKTMAEGLSVRQAQVTDLRARLAELQERERQAMARELHDNIGQLVTGIAVQSFMLKQQHQQPGFVVRASEQIQTLCEEIQLSLRQMTQQLYPVTLGRLGLVSALGELCSRWQDIHPFRINFSPMDTPLPSEPVRDTHVYRIVQEAITNAAKHARARQLNISLSHDDQQLTVIIEDDGVGIDASRQSQGLGLASMQDRASLIHGQIAFSKRSPGTRIQLIAPLHIRSSDTVEEQHHAITYS